MAAIEGCYGWDAAIGAWGAPVPAAIVEDCTHGVEPCALHVLTDPSFEAWDPETCPSKCVEGLLGEIEPTTCCYGEPADLAARVEAEWWAWGAELAAELAEDCAIAVTPEVTCTAPPSTPRLAYLGQVCPR